MRTVLYASHLTLSPASSLINPSSKRASGENERLNVLRISKNECNFHLSYFYIFWIHFCIAEYKCIFYLIINGIEKANLFFEDSLEDSKASAFIPVFYYLLPFYESGQSHERICWKGYHSVLSCVNFEVFSFLAIGSSALTDLLAFPIVWPSDVIFWLFWEWSAFQIILQCGENHCNGSSADIIVLCHFQLRFQLAFIVYFFSRVLQCNQLVITIIQSRNDSLCDISAVEALPQ